MTAAITGMVVLVMALFFITWLLGEVKELTVSFQERERDLLDLLHRSNDLCRSMNSIAERDGRETNWEAFRGQLAPVLDAQHAELYVEEIVGSEGAE